MDKYERRIRVAELHNAILAMAGRYADALADYTSKGAERAWRSSRRRYHALQRLTRALGDLAERG